MGEVVPLCVPPPTLKARPIPVSDQRRLPPSSLPSLLSGVLAGTGTLFLVFSVGFVLFKADEEGVAVFAELSLDAQGFFWRLLTAAGILLISATGFAIAAHLTRKPDPIGRRERRFQKTIERLKRVA